MFYVALTSIALADVCIIHHELKNSSNPIQTFSANISDAGSLKLDPYVRYRTGENNDLHVVQMKKTECDINCTYRASVHFEKPEKIMYTISSGEGFGHAVWSPPEGMYGTFWILPRDPNWITVDAPKKVDKPHAIVRASPATGVGTLFFVFADSGEKVPFEETMCSDTPCEQTAEVSTGTRSRVDYYISSEDGRFFWPTNATHATFEVSGVESETPQNHHKHTLSDGAWAGIGIGIAIGTALVVYGIYYAVSSQRRRPTAENQRLIGGASL